MLLVFFLKRILWLRRFWGRGFVGRFDRRAICRVLPAFGLLVPGRLDLVTGGERSKGRTIDIVAE